MDSQKLDTQDRDRSGERGVCSECGLEYVPYVILVKDIFLAITDYIELEKKGYLCRQCLFEFSTSHEYAIIEDPSVEIEGDPGARLKYGW